jgi:vancomycin resistance protein YoaR
MPRLSPHFKQTLLWALLGGGLVVAGTWAGAWWYTRALQNGAPVSVHSLQANLVASSQHPLTLLLLDKEVTVKAATIQQWLEPYTRAYTGQKDIRISDRLTDYLVKLGQQVQTPPQDVRFVIANGNITIVAPSKKGTALDVAGADQIIRHSLLSNVSNVVLPFQETDPAITEDTIANLHLTDKLATGQSNFSGSTIARIQNVTVASKLYNGILIPAGQTFSFNTILGAVDAEHGYAPEKVIKGQTIAYEYGGGICQVSSTVFRAAVNAGFPIVERKPHAFPVHYYEPQGFDATIYPGVSDLRFINDTPSYVLVQTRIEGKNLYVDFYGTSDGRAVSINGPIQYDIQPDGAMKATLTRTITYADGTAKSDRFNSVYKSPALYPTEPNPYL